MFFYSKSNKGNDKFLPHNQKINNQFHFPFDRASTVKLVNWTLRVRTTHSIGIWSLCFERRVNILTKWWRRRYDVLSSKVNLFTTLEPVRRWTVLTACVFF